jgi:RNA polymerase sigma-70 factor (ECF subfamily)
MKVHRARGAYVRGADPLPWIYSIAHRTFIDEVRKTKRAIVKVGSDDAVPEVAAGITGESADRVDEPRVDPEEAKAALDALAQLPEQQREAVVLTKLEGKTVAEAAEIAGTTVGAMKVRAHRGYEALRKLLGASAPAAKKAAAGLVAMSLLVGLGLAAVLGVAVAMASIGGRVTRRLPHAASAAGSAAGGAS